MKIALDAMGGDFAPEKTVAGAVSALKKLSKNTKLILFGHNDEIYLQLKKRCKKRCI